MGKRWVPLESNPEVINDFTQKLGLDTSKHSFCDVFGLDPVSKMNHQLFKKSYQCSCSVRMSGSTRGLCAGAAGHDSSALFCTDPAFSNHRGYRSSQGQTCALLSCTFLGLPECQSEYYIWLSHLTYLYPSILPCKVVCLLLRSNPHLWP